MTLQGKVFDDGEKKSRNQVLLLGNRELHIDEIVLAFAFLPAGQSILNPAEDFKNFLHFEALTSNQQYNFKSQSGYDSSLQSAWMTAPLSEVVPYTMVIQIQEIREGNSFAKLMQTVYLENESKIRGQINNKINNLKEPSNKN